MTGHGWEQVTYALLSLTVIRMLPMFLSLTVDTGQCAKFRTVLG